MGFHLFTGGNPFNDLIGVAAGHSYVYLTEVLPDSHGYELLKTPKIMHALVAKLNGDAGGDGRRGGGPAGGGRMHFINNDGAQANPGARDNAGRAAGQGDRDLNRNAAGP